MWSPNPFGLIPQGDDFHYRVNTYLGYYDNTGPVGELGKNVLNKVTYPAQDIFNWNPELTHDTKKIWEW